MVGVHTMLQGDAPRQVHARDVGQHDARDDERHRHEAITTITWFLSGSLAGVAGTVLGISEGNLTPASGELFLFVIFAAVIVGGVGSIYGAMAGAILIGLATEISAAFINPSYKLDIAFVILILDPAHPSERTDRSRGDDVAVTYYVFTLVFFLFDYFILAMGLNIQYGETGILNFAYIGFVAIGAYFTGVFSLHSAAGTGQFYILGWGLPFPINLLLGGVAAMCFAFVVALISLRRLRTDYLAIVLISLSLVLYDFCNNYVGLFNGADGLFNVPEPFAKALGLNVNSFIPFFACLTGVIVALHVVRHEPHDALSDGSHVPRDPRRPRGRRGARQGRLPHAAQGDADRLVLCRDRRRAAHPVRRLVQPDGLAARRDVRRLRGAARRRRREQHRDVRRARCSSRRSSFICRRSCRRFPAIPGLIEYFDLALVGIVLMLMLWFRPQGAVPERARRTTSFGVIRAQRRRLRAWQPAGRVRVRRTRT